MKKRIIGILTVAVLFACGGDKPTQEEGNKENKKEKENKEVVEEVKKEVIEETSGPDYEADWNRFKKAVLEKDIPGIGAFASSDAVDAEALLFLFSEDWALDELKSASYSDLQEVEMQDGKYLEFSAGVSGSDDEGNIYESGVMVYFSRGEEGLLLDYFIAAG